MSRPFIIVLVVVLATGTAALGYVFDLRLKTDSEFEEQIRLAQSEARQIRYSVVFPRDKKINAGENFTAALQKFGLSPEDAANSSAAAQHAFNLRQVRAGNTITVDRSVEGELREIDYKIDADRILKILPNANGYSAAIQEIPSKIKVVAVSGQVEDSLFDAVAEAGESPELAMRLAEIFRYDIDFYTDPRKGDTFRVVMEKKLYENGQSAGYGKIFTAEYKNAGKKWEALLFRDQAGRPAYYNEDGKSLQKAFLRSPLKFRAPITSHFSRSRFHPILRIYRPHLGTDYAAPIGTPVQAIGRGIVAFAGRLGGEGNAVHIRHTNGYETMYLHLSRLFVRTGQRVEMGKIIGLVGSTGLSTGPHLDFRILDRGKYKNFERLNLPPSDPVSKKNLEAFVAVRGKWLPLLQHPDLLQAEYAGSSESGAR